MANKKGIRGREVIRQPAKGKVKKSKCPNCRYISIALLAVLIIVGFILWYSYNAPEQSENVTIKVVNSTPKPVVKDETCGCIDEFVPVCAGSVMYSSKCVADCKGVTGYVEGECNNPSGKTFFKCEKTTGGLSAQYNPVCGRVHRLDQKDYLWKTFANALTACRADRPEKEDMIGYTRGECSS